MISYLNSIKNILSNPLWQNVAAIIVTSIFLIFINTYLLFPAIQKAEDDAVKLQNNIAFHTQDLLNLFIQVRFEDLTNIGQQLWIDQRQPDAISKDTKTFFTSKPDFLNVTIIDAQGNVVAIFDRSHSKIATQSASLKDTLLFTEVFKNGKQYISPVYFGQHGPTLRISAPIKENNQIVGVIAGDIALTLLWETVKTPFVVDGKVYLVDARGNIIADPDRTRSLSGENLKYRTVVNRLINGEQTVVLEEYANEKKETVIAYGLRMASSNWGIVVEQNKVKALQQRENTILVAYGFSGASLTLIFLLALGTFRLAHALIKVRDEQQIISTERNKLEIVLSGITDAVIAIDLNGNIVTFNKAAQQITGYGETDVLNKPINALLKVFDHNQEITSTTYAPIQKDNFAELIFQRRDLKIIGNHGKEILADIVSGQIKEGPAVNLGCIITMHDVTQEKQLEKMKLDFVAIAAHELRTPLTSIKGYLSVFINENQKNLDANQNNLLYRANDATQQLGALIENLLNISNIERNTFTVNLDTTDWVSIARQTVNEFMKRATEKKVALTFVEPTLTIPFIKADKLRLNEVLSNLLSNAIAYTPTGGNIQVSLEQKENEVITHVQDTGIGIPQDALPNLFTKFFRVSGVLENYSKGTGLGLYISKGIIELHHGKIWVTSTVGHGSTFSFAVPTI